MTDIPPPDSLSTSSADTGVTFSSSYINQSSVKFIKQRITQAFQ
jgi:hypothetical protein